MFQQWRIQVACKLAAVAVLLGAQPFVLARASERFPPRFPGSRQPNEKLRLRGFLDRRSGPGHKPAFSARSAAGDMASSQRSNPVSCSQAQTPSLASGLSIIGIVAAHLQLRTFFTHRGWSFPSSVAGMLGLFAGLVGFDRVAPSHAERAARVLEAGSVQLSAWLPVLFVPALHPWVRAPFRVPLFEILSKSGSLSEAFVTAAKLAARRAAANAASDYLYEDRLASPVTTGGAPAKAARGVRSAVNVASLLLSVAGGWLVSFRSAAAVVPALSSSSSSTAAAAPIAAAADASSWSATSVTTADVGSFDRFVRRLGVGMVASGLMSTVSFVVIHKSMPSVNAKLKKFEPLSNKAMQKKVSSPEGRAEVEEALGIVLLMSVTGFTGAVLSTGLATLFGFAAGHAGVRPGGLFSRSSCAPWKAALLPVVASATATAVCAAALNLASAGFPPYVGEENDMPGAGNLLLSLRGPAVLSFAAPLYRMRGVIFSNARQVVGGSIFCASATLISAALGFRLLGVPKAFQTMLQGSPQTGPTSVTLALGNALRAVSPWSAHKLLPPKDTSVAAALGTYATPAAAGVLVVTGVLGATVGARVLDKLGVTDKMVQGLIQGGTSNVLGVAATAAAAPGHPDGLVVATPTGGTASARDVSTVAMILAGTAGTILVNIPIVRSALLSIALGSSVATAPVPLSAAERSRWRRRADGGPFGFLD